MKVFRREKNFMSHLKGKTEGDQQKQNVLVLEGISILNSAVIFKWFPVEKEWVKILYSTVS